MAVDDEPAILELLEHSLIREGYSIDTVGSAGEFRDCVSKVEYNLFIIDLTLPDGNGLNLIREVRPHSQAGIIILTGRGDETDQVVGLEIGADDYVTKPFRPRELAARVNALHRRASAQLAAPANRVEQTSGGPAIDHEFEGYRVSIGARRVWTAGGEEILLTTAEFSVLQAFMESRGRVLTRDQIMTLAKGRDWESYDRAIDGLVSRLRKKLPNPSGNGHFIRTVHNIGYVFGG
nr:response regulator transcription factor [Szabonella alba]